MSHTLTEKDLGTAYTMHDADYIAKYWGVKKTSQIAKELGLEWHNVSYLARKMGLKRSGAIGRRMRLDVVLPGSLIVAAKVAAAKEDIPFEQLVEKALINYITQ